MLINLVTVQHGGTHFSKELLDRLDDVKYRHCHTDTRSLRAFFSGGFTHLPTLLVHRRPQDVANSYYRRCIVNTGEVAPRLVTEAVRQWFEGMFLVKDLVENTFRFVVGRSDMDQQLINLCNWLKKTPTPAAFDLVNKSPLLGRDERAALLHKSVKVPEEHLKILGLTPADFNN